MHMGTAGRASVESLHALDSYQQSMPVNRVGPIHITQSGNVVYDM